MNIREVKKIVKGYSTIDGAGVKLIRVLGKNDVTDIDPFLMLDAFGSENPKDYIKGFPMHPHRGIETITYLFEGRIDHRDSLGNSSTLIGGNLQWMTAGSGIIHEEMPKETEKMFGLQFWLNLPMKEKMTQPSYFPISSEMIQTIEITSGKIKLIAGDYLGYRGIISKYVKVTMMDIILKPNTAYDIQIPEQQNTFIYIVDGDAQFGEKKTKVEKHSVAIFDKGITIHIEALNSGIRFVLLAGMPLNEPIAWGGPIVMNTEAELETAFRELNNDTFIKK